jgi:uncharacterized membrane protein
VESIEYHDNGKVKQVNHYDLTKYSVASHVVPTRWVMLSLLLAIVIFGILILVL